MRFLSSLCWTLSILASTIFAAPTTLHDIQRLTGETSGKYIVKFKEGVSPEVWVRKLGLAEGIDWKHFNGLASHLSDEALNTLRTSSEVQSISEDGIIHLTGIQTNATWGLQRISSLGKITTRGPADVLSLNFTYAYDDSAGAGVDIYVVDTGIFVDHTQFNGGRATWGYTAAGLVGGDTYGHGTHCAGVAGGFTYGVAKNANLIAVKVFHENGTTSTSIVLDGLNWVIGNSKRTGRPSITSMSFSSYDDKALDDAVATVTAAGIHAVVAAGNDGWDASANSPARVPSVITVGASNIHDVMTDFSNYGPAVDIFAPGEDIISAWINGPYSSIPDSGTSMATPHVSGIVACLISKDGNISPAEMAVKIKNYSVKNALTGIPSGTSTLDYLAHNSS